MIIFAHKNVVFQKLDDFLVVKKDEDMNRIRNLRNKSLINEC